MRKGCYLSVHSFLGCKTCVPGELVEFRLLGKRRSAEVQILAGETGVVEHFAMMARDNHQFAKFNKIGMEAPTRQSPSR